MSAMIFSLRMAPLGSTPWVQIPAWGLDSQPALCSVSGSKPAAPLQECVIRRVFFAQNQGLSRGHLKEEGAHEI